MQVTGMIGRIRRMEGITPQQRSILSDLIGVVRTIPSQASG
jgi:hypothetical protein